MGNPSSRPISREQRRRLFPRHFPSCSRLGRTCPRQARRGMLFQVPPRVLWGLEKGSCAARGGHAFRQAHATLPLPAQGLPTCSRRGGSAAFEQRKRQQVQRFCLLEGPRNQTRRPGERGVPRQRSATRRCSVAPREMGLDEEGQSKPGTSKSLFPSQARGGFGWRKRNSAWGFGWPCSKEGVLCGGRWGSRRRCWPTARTKTGGS